LRVLAQSDQFAFEDLKDGRGSFPAHGGAFVRRGVSLAQLGFDRKRSTEPLYPTAA
jgi:hypothetical protein